MGGLPRKQPVRDGHRDRFVLVRYWAHADEFSAKEWAHRPIDLIDEPKSCPLFGPTCVWIIMSRADFEAREREGRAVDLCAPPPGRMPRCG